MPVFAELPADLDTTLSAYLCLRRGIANPRRLPDGDQFHPESIVAIEGKRLLADCLGVPMPAAVGS